MDKADIWMPLFIGDYLASTSRLTTEQHGAYLLLIMDYWKNGALPDNDQILAQIARLAPDAWSMHRAVLKQFFTVSDGQWRHARIEKELSAAREKKVKAREKAEAAARARWEKQKARKESQEQCSTHAPSKASGNASALHEECPSPSPSPSPSDSNSKDMGAGKRRQRAHQLPDDFEPTEKHRALAGELGVILIDEFAKFRDYHRAKGSTMKDWNAALNNWLRNAKDFQRGKTSGPPGRKSTSQSFHELDYSEGLDEHGHAV